MGFGTEIVGLGVGLTSEQKRLSKFLSYVLRHHPEVAGVGLEPGGWADLETLSNAAAEQGLTLNETTLRTLIAQSPKPRFEVKHGKVRARYGHSVAVDTELTPTSPPDILFHGTATRFLDAIRREGLARQSRQYVHLSDDKQSAREVGARHGRPVVLTVEAGQMARDGYVFYHSADNIWLTREVPPRYLSVLDNEL
ncbi:MAG: RNA 2'-phosphotransferase [Trueperaceae bacterium]|nr:RNA 2'-phosphotransferase [Trueperaceae bacterium]